ncbi:MAG: patatin-like phospholipase family protein [Oscillospiraceae bacterium]
MSLKCNATFEGGGVRGIGHVGAACVMEKAGYQFANLTGSSAGAIVASLLAVGYTGLEIKEEMKTLDYLKFKQKDVLDYFGVAGKLFSVLFEFGIYNADYFENWLHNLLLKKGKTVFGDIKADHPILGMLPYKLQVTASDLTDEKLLILPGDLKKFGIDPDTYSIAKAVRMSMCIPIFYEPFRLKDSNGLEHFIVDGGLLSNYPIWILDDGKTNPEFPTFGFKFVEDSTNRPIRNESGSKMDIVDYIKLIVSTALDSCDKQYISISSGDYQRTIAIPTTIKVYGKHKNISATDFNITKTESAALFNSGSKAAESFLSSWDFENWKKTYRCDTI